MKPIYGLTVAFSLLASTALADDRTPAKEADKFAGHEGKAWSILHDGILEHLSPHAASQLKFMVYHAVAKELCDGVETDPAKLKKAIDAIHPENWDELSEEDHKKWTNAFLVSYGATLGVMLAEHAEHIEPFCKGVNDVLADKEEAEHSYFAAKAN